MASWFGYTGPGKCVHIQAIEDVSDCNFAIESPSEYLEHNIFPYLLPAMEEMLKVAMKTEVSILF
jgi:uncharacterized protein (UPF0276 family)